jgi:hypothetical protein
MIAASKRQKINSKTAPRNTLNLFATSKINNVSVETMKMRTIKLNPNFIVKAIQGKSAVFTSNLPDDIELLEIKYDLFEKEVYAIVRSDSFKEIADVYPIPGLNLTYTNVQPEIKPKTKPKPIAIKKPEAKHKERTLVPTSQNLIAVKEEFNPEQRELLRFTADGDYVIIKPTQYLKAEWNEINDVVRSLGGRWVKGDFSSYWEIQPE